MQIGGWQARPIISIDLISDGALDFKSYRPKFFLGFSMNSPDSVKSVSVGLAGMNSSKGVFFQSLSVEYAHKIPPQIVRGKASLGMKIGIGPKKGQHVIEGKIKSVLGDLEWRHNIFLNG